MSEQPPPLLRAEVIKEARRIEESGEYTSKGHFVAAQFWQGVHIVLGAAIAVVAAITASKSAGELTTNIQIITILSLVVAASSALYTFLNPGKRHADHINAGNNFDALRSRARVFANVDCCPDSSLSADDIRAGLKAISEHREKLKSAGIHVPQWAYWIAKKQIKKGQTTYAVDENK